MSIACASLLLALTGTLLGQAPEKFAGPRAGPLSFTVLRDVEFRAQPKLTFDLYRPSGESVVPIVVFANIGSMDMKTWTGYVGWAEAVAGAGMAAITYQSTAETASSDLAALLTVVGKRAAASHLDPLRLVIWCSSANVNVGLPFAMDARRSDVRAAVVYYGAAEIPRIRLDVPVFLARAGRDSPGLNERIDALLKRALGDNAPWTFVNVATGIHGFDVWGDSAIVRDVIARTIDFMKAATSPAASREFAEGANEAANSAAFARGEWQTAVAGYRTRVAALPDDAEGHRRLPRAFADAAGASRRGAA